jgi:hypothetical protein
VICASAPDAQSLRRHSAGVPQESNAVTQFRLMLGRFARACRRYDGGRVADREQRVEVVHMDGGAAGAAPSGAGASHTGGGATLHSGRGHISGFRGVTAAWWVAVR